jgi:hypothetical protein
VQHEDPQGRRISRSCCCLAGCGAVDPISKGLTRSRAIETDLELTTGMKPDVGFGWHNGSLQSVTVTFPQVYAGKPLDELAGTVREVVAKRSSNIRRIRSCWPSH